MANKILNDKNEYVIAVGQDGSVARMKVKYPALLSKLNDNYNEGGTEKSCLQVIRESGVTDTEETIAIIRASNYGVQL